MAVNFAELVSVTSETLQAKIRQLLPSQQGFGNDLQALNVITPIIDLTPTAEGNIVPANMAEAINFGGSTAFDVQNASTVLANTAGFWRIRASVTVLRGSGIDISGVFNISDGSTSKTVLGLEVQQGGALLTSQNYDFVVFLTAGDSITAVSNNNNAIITGSYSQIADVNGNRTLPSGFSPQ